jgi:hypothetical protein
VAGAVLRGELPAESRQLARQPPHDGPIPGVPIGGKKDGADPVLPPEIRVVEGLPELFTGLLGDIDISQNEIPPQSCLSFCLLQKFWKIRVASYPLEVSMEVVKGMILGHG